MSPYKWVLSRLTHAVKSTIEAMETYSFNNATNAGQYGHPTEQ